MKPKILAIKIIYANIDITLFHENLASIFNTYDYIDENF